MPYRRSYKSSGTRRSGSRRKYSRRSGGGGTNWMSMAKTALKTAKYVAALVNAESKYDQTVITGGVCDDTTGSIQLICNPPQGTAANARSGDSIKMQTLTLRGNFDASTAVSPNATFRIMVVLDKENAITTLAQLLQVTGGANTPFSPKNEDTKYDSKVLWDQHFVTGTAYPTKAFERVIHIGEHVHFTAGTTTITNNALKVFVMSNIPLVSAPLVNYIARVTYLDN